MTLGADIAVTAAAPVPCKASRRALPSTLFSSVIISFKKCRVSSSMLRFFESLFSNFYFYFSFLRFSLLRAQLLLQRLPFPKPRSLPSLHVSRQSSFFRHQFVQPLARFVVSSLRYQKLLI